MLKRLTARKCLAIYDAGLRAMLADSQKQPPPTTPSDELALTAVNEGIRYLRAKIEMPFGYQSPDRTPEETEAILGNLTRSFRNRWCLVFWALRASWLIFSALHKLAVKLR